MTEHDDAPHGGGGNQPRTGFFGRNKKKLLGGTGALAVAGAGTAVAALVLTTGFSGQAVVNADTKNATDAITDIELVQEEDMDCTNITIEQNGQSFSVQASVDSTTIQGENGNTALVEDTAGHCVFDLTMTNSGQVPIKYGHFGLTKAPPHWSAAKIGPNEGGFAVAPGTTETIRVKIAADFGAGDGKLRGELTASPTQ